MPTSNPAEFRRRATALVRSDWSVTKTAHDLDVTTTVYNWVKQGRIDRGEIAGVSTKESRELTKAHRRIRELEAEVEILRRAHDLLSKDVLRPKGPTR